MGIGAGIAGFICFVADSLLSLLALAILISAVLSWLVAFDVVNYRNRFVAGLAQALDTVTQPVLAPFRRVIPPLGTIDITPIIVLILIRGIQAYLLPASCRALGLLMGGF